jgi:hypothetical protein
MKITFNNIEVKLGQLPPHPHINVDVAMEQFVRAFGGTVISDLVGSSPNFDNADYYFSFGNGVVVELKRIVVDQSHDLALKAKLNEKYLRWMEQGIVPPLYGRRLIESRTLPESCQREIMALLSLPINERFKKANKQIRETKVALNFGSASGLVLLVNDGNYILNLDMALHLIRRALGNHYRSINSVVYLTANLYAESPATSFPTLVWVHGTRPGMTSVDLAFVNRFFEGWRSYHARLTGTSVTQITLGDDTHLEAIKLRTPRAGRGRAR